MKTRFCLFILVLVIGVLQIQAQTDSKYSLNKPLDKSDNLRWGRQFQKYNLRGMHVSAAVRRFLPPNFDKLPEGEKEALLQRFLPYVQPGNSLTANNASSASLKKSKPADVQSNFWQKTNGPYGGFANCFASIPADSGGTNLFVGTVNGVFLSSNNGTSWTAVNSGLPNDDVECLAVIGTSLFAGTALSGVFLSTNNGANWVAVNTGIFTTPSPSRQVAALAVFSNDSGGTSLLAGTAGGLYVSTNNGTNWGTVNFGVTGAVVAALTVSPNGSGGTNIFVGTFDGGVFLSTDNGVTWTGAADNPTLDAGDIFCLAASGTNLFAGTYGGVVVSTNDGTTWINAPPPPPGEELPFEANVSALTISDNGEGGTNLFAGTDGDGIYLSTDNGTTWSPFGLTSNIISSISIIDTNLFVGTDVGPYLSTDGGMTWSAPLVLGLTNSSITAFAGRGGNLFAGTAGNGIALTTDNGATWTSINSGLTNPYVNALAVIDTNVIAATQGGVFLSSNNGTNWVPVNVSPSCNSVSAFAVIDSNLFAGTPCNGVFLSTDNGESWSPASSELADVSVFSLGVSGMNLFAGTPGSVFLSTNNGANWNAANTGLNEDIVFCFAASGTLIFAGSNYGVFLSSNNGTSWTSVNSGFPPDVPVYSLAVSGIGSNGVNIFAGTWGGGVLFSTNTGSSWNAVNDGLTTLAVPSLIFDSSDGHIYAGTPGASVFRSAERVVGGTISGVAFNDLNGNGMMDAGEPLFQFWTVRLFQNGIQIDSTLTTGTGYQFNDLDSGTYVVREKPFPGHAITLPASTYYTVTLGIGDTTSGRNLDFGNYSAPMRVERYWNLVSLPMSTQDNRTPALFPSAISGASAYNGNYVINDTLKVGIGYWLKFDTAGVINITGSQYLQDTIPVVSGWNLLGSISMPVPVSSILSNPPRMVTSNFFGYHGDYVALDTIYPGKGYWVKVEGSGSLVLSWSSLGSKTSRIRIVPTHELPPPPPESKGAPTAIPKEFALLQNYPNPFNPTTLIQYALPQASYVTLKIYNVLGQVVATPVNGEQSAGYKSVQFDATNLPSGVYLYRMQAGTYSATKKLLLMK
jgi:photosystem II stability/assembly factor-like uncharacterized protein